MLGNRLSYIGACMVTEERVDSAKRVVLADGFYVYSLYNYSADVERDKKGWFHKKGWVL